MIAASSSTMRNTAPSSKPSVFITPYSFVRSRIAITMVFAATSRIANATARPMTRITNGRLPYMLTNPAWNARSDSVRVAAEEFSNIASTCFAIWAARVGSASFST